MRFLFDCDDEVCLPRAYQLVDEIKPFVDKMKSIDVDENNKKTDRKSVLKLVVKNMMVKFPKETGELLGKLWILDEGEEKPNTFKTMATFFSNEVAVDFFTSVMPSLLQMSSVISPLLK
jgi:hypothetical protein